MPLRIDNQHCLPCRCAGPNCAPAVRTNRAPLCQWIWRTVQRVFNNYIQQLRPLIADCISMNQQLMKRFGRSGELIWREDADGIEWPDRFDEDTQTCSCCRFSLLHPLTFLLSCSLLKHARETSHCHLMLVSHKPTRPQWPRSRSRWICIIEALLNVCNFMHTFVFFSLEDRK